MLTRIDREEETAAHSAKLLVEILPADARLDHNIHIVLVELDDLVHERKVDTDAAVRRREIPFQARTPRVGDDGYPIFVADARYS